MPEPGSRKGTGTFSSGGVFKSPVAADDVLVWVAPFSATVRSVKSWQDVGTGCVVNAFTGSLASPTTFLASDHTIAAADTVEDAGAVQNVSLVAGNKVYIRLTSVAGAPNEVGVQVNLTRS